MAEIPSDAERTKARIAEAARDLFATRGIKTVSVRDIAESAGVTHGLVHHYFGSKEQMVQDILGREIARANELTQAMFADSADPLETIRMAIRHYFVEGRTAILLIIRASMAGMNPEKLLAEGAFRPLGAMTAAIIEMRDGQPVAGGPDPALASAYVGAALFGMVMMHPWLLSGAGLDDDEYEQRIDELVDISVQVMRSAAGI